MNSNPPQVRIPAARVSLDGAQGDHLSVEAALVQANDASLRASFLAISARYVIGAPDVPDSAQDPCSGFAASYRGLLGHEIADLVVTRLQDQLHDREEGGFTR